MKIKGSRKWILWSNRLISYISKFIEYKNNVMFGRDLLNSKDESVIFRNGSFTDGKVFYISPVNSYYDIKLITK